MPEPVAVPWRWRFAAEQVEGRFGFLHDRRGDEGDARGVLHVDLVRRQARGAAARRCGGRDRRRSLDRRDRLLRRRVAGGGDHGDDDAAAEQGGDEGDGEQCVFMAGQDERSGVKADLKACRVGSLKLPGRVRAPSAARARDRRARISVSPTSTASHALLAASSRSCSAREIPDSETTITPRRHQLEQPLGALDVDA